MQAIMPSNPRLARFIIFGELMKRASSTVASARISSMCRNSRMHPTIEMARHPEAITEVRRAAVILRNSGLESGKSFQVPALEDQDCGAQGHRRIKQRVERVLQDELQTEWLLMRDRADHIERGEVRHQIGGGRGEPTGHARSQGGESAKIVGEATDDEQGEGEDRRKQRRRERREQQCQRTDDEEFKNDEIECDQDQRIGRGKLMNHVEQRAKDPNRHKKRVHDQRSRQPQELADNELPAADRPREHGVERALFDFFRDQPDSNEDGDDYAEKRDCRQPQVDDDQTLYVDGNLTNENGGPRKQQGEGDQVIENAIANRLAESVKRNIKHAWAHDLFPTVVWECCSFSTK